MGDKYCHRTLLKAYVTMGFAPKPKAYWSPLYVADDQIDFLAYGSAPAKSP